MTNEERDLIAKFVARVGGAEVGGFSRSVPSTTPALPPIDPEADQFIAQQFQAHPEARYRITQMAVVHEAALNEAANRIQQLQAEVQRLQQQVQAQAAAPAPSRGGFLGGLFGSGQPQQQAPQPGVWNQGQGQPYPQEPGYQPPPPQYAPAAQPGMFQRSGSGFLGSALTTAAGVAGGMVAGNALMDLFSGGHSGGGLFGGGGGGFGGAGAVPEETTIINNYGDDYNNAPGQALPDPGWDNDTQDQPDDNSGGWDDNSGGGWDDNSST
ncbi:MAG TPA: DUF2076 domain-containing protein [Acetobacteraceae bacterium]